MEKEAPDEVEMAAQEDKKREKAEEAAQDWVKIIKNVKMLFLIKLFN